MVWRAVLSAVLVSTTPPADPLACDALVHDPSGELDVEAVTAAATEIATTLGADLHVRAERDLDGALDARMAQLQTQCPTWSSGTDRAPELVVVMYSSTDREASVFYGPGQASQLEFRWEHAVDEMGPLFAAGDFTGGVLAGLAALGEDPPRAYTPTISPTRYADDDGSSTGSTGVPPIVWFALVALVLVALVRVAQFLRTGSWDAGDDDDSGSSWRSSRRSSGWRSSSGGSRRSFSSSRSSSSRRGRSGGGTKKW